ncbi:hypothetical protein B0H66DRAFT_620690 [Apodospora peruviana]|uniref:Uncharacterized protein n=1 Tax=Apodospora peruviana TaxID=516989 RepID=A0AAE0M852_9PEZI|nr:hypothetical protein B0H66DRAFT_620690 [Apodospora peruviana]
MEDWGRDVYCAICGGPLVEVEFAPGPPVSPVSPAQHDDHAAPSLRAATAGHTGYDRDILPEDDAGWTDWELMLLGFNRIPNGNRRMAHSFKEDCTYLGLGYVDISGGLGPHSENFPHYFDSPEFPYYVGNDALIDPVFPFHEVCHDMLVARLNFHMEASPSQFYYPKPPLLAEQCTDLLYEVMYELSGRSRLNIEYGSPAPQNQRRWVSYPGEEIFAANPACQHAIQTKIGVIKLPFDFLIRIAELCDDPTCFLNWSNASWIAHTRLWDAQPAFWRRAIWFQMEWFEELLDLLEEAEMDDKLRKGSSMRTLYLWAAQKSKPGLNMKKGEFLSVANRRRIWTRPCAKLPDGPKIIGLAAQMRMDTSSKSFARLGLITAFDNLADPYHHPELLSPAQRANGIQWKQDGAHLQLSHGLLDFEAPAGRIMLTTTIGGNPESMAAANRPELHPELLSHEALIWEKNEREVRQLKRI